MATIMGERIANADVKRLAPRASKAAENRERFNQWARKTWQDKQQPYYRRVLETAENVLHVSRPATSTAVVAIVEGALRELTAGDPVQVLAEWQKSRAKELAAFLSKRLSCE